MTIIIFQKNSITKKSKPHISLIKFKYMYFNTHFESKLDNSPYGTQQHFHRQKLINKTLDFLSKCCIVLTNFYNI